MVDATKLSKMAQEMIEGGFDDLWENQINRILQAAIIEDPDIAKYAELVKPLCQIAWGEGILAAAQKIPVITLEILNAGKETDHDREPV